jgi:hypothetical protein
LLMVNMPCFVVFYHFFCDVHQLTVVFEGERYTFYFDKYTLKIIRSPS